MWPDYNREIEVIKLKPLAAVLSGIVYAGLMCVLWFGFHGSELAISLGSLFPRAFANFAILLAPLWFFGFAAGEPLRNLPSAIRVCCAGLLSTSYFAFAARTTIFNWRAALIVVAFPVLLAAFLEWAKLANQMAWRDGAVLAIIAATYYLKWLGSAWPPELAFLPKLFLADVALYCFLVIRAMEGSGYWLVPAWSSLKIGMREWAFFLPLALLIGELTGFIHFHRALPHLGNVVAALLLTFLLIAIPEELFFRSILQNLLETRIGRRAALLVTAALFGLSHFNHGSRFNWRYVLLASIAGIFYGRAWRAERQIFASLVTHTAVDVVWSLWFR